MLFGEYCWHGSCFHFFHTLHRNCRRKRYASCLSGCYPRACPGMLEINGKWLGVLTGIVGILFCCQAVWPYREALRNWENCLANRHVLAEEVDVRYRPLMNSSFFLANCSLLLNQSGEHVKALEVADRGVCLYHSYGCCVEKGIAMENLGCYDAAEVVWIQAG